MSILKTKVKVMLFTKASQQGTNENISNENNGNKKMCCLVKTDKLGIRVRNLSHESVC